jgi:hypothetical protein
MQIAAFLAISLLALVVHLPFLKNLPFDSDQAIVGLMGLHVLKGEFPILYYGDSYGGALEPFLASVVFLLFGADRFWLHGVSLLFTLLFIISVYQLGSELYHRVVGLWAMLTASLPLFYVALYSSMTYGGYMEILWLGNLILVYSHRWAGRTGSKQPVLFHLFILGFFWGLSWWTYPLSLVYMLTSCLFISWVHKSFILKGRCLWAGLGFLLGSLPFWLWNIKHGFPFFSFVQSAEGVPYRQKISAIFFNFSQFFGYRPGEAFSWGAFLFLLLIIISLILPLVRGKWLSRQFPNSRPTLLIILFATVFLVLYSGSRFSEKTVLRYLLPLYSLYPLTLGILLYSLSKRTRWGTWLLLAGVFLFFLNEYNTFYSFIQRQAVKNQQQSQVEKAMNSFLKEKQITTSYAPEYWSAAQLTFDAREEGLFAQPFNDRYPFYTFLADASPNPAFVLEGKHTQSFEEMLSAMGGVGQKKLFAFHQGIKGIVVQYGFQLPKKSSLEIFPRQWRSTSNSNPETSPKAFDRNRATYWTSGIPQQPGLFYQLDLGQAYRLDRLVLLAAKGKEWDFPAAYRVELSQDLRSWNPIVWVPHQWAYLFWSLDHPVWKLREGRIEIDLQGLEARYIKITLTGSTRYYWAMGEIFVYRQEKAAQQQPLPLDELLTFLDQEKIRFLYADVVLSARVTQATLGKVKCLTDEYDITRAQDYKTNGYNDPFPYVNDLKRIVDFSQSPAFILKKENAPALEEVLESLKVSCVSRPFGDHILYYQLKSPAFSVARGKQVKPSLYWTGTHLLNY